MSAVNTYGRIWRTASGSYVGDGHEDAAILAAGPADPLPDDFDPDAFGSTVPVVAEVVEEEAESAVEEAPAEEVPEEAPAKAKKK